MATLKVDTITSDTLPTVSITDGLSISGVTTNIGKIVGLDVIDIDANNKALRIGASQELQLTYTGSAAEIKNIDASSPITIKVKDGDETAAAFNANGTVDLYHNNVRTFATDSAGAIVYGPEGGEGHLYLFADEGDDNADKWRLNAHTNGNFYLQEKNTGSWVTKMYAQGGAGKVALMHNTTEMFETTSTGVKIPVATSGHGITIESTTNVYPQFTLNADRSGEDQSCGYLRAQWNDTDIAAIDFVAGPDTTNKDDGKIRFQTRLSGSGIAERMRIDSTGKVKIFNHSTNDLRSLSVLAPQSQIQWGTAEDVGGFLMSASNGQFGLSGGGYWNGSNWVATHTGSTQIRHDGDGEISFCSNTSLTSGNTFVPTERMTLNADGHFLIGKTSTSIGTQGTTILGSGEIWITKDGSIPLSLNRGTNDGELVRFHQGGTNEGNISVSGSTISYNGGHLSRWSQLVGISTNVKSDRPTIYQGTVMSNLDAMCEWSGETNQQLNKTKVSDTASDKDVAGVFWAWDDDDDEYVNDFYVAMTGDMVIRVAGSTTVARGDLLESAGDGTAKPQSDDIVRSKTIAKIISTTSTATYADGSKAYPCVLMAC